MTFLKLKEAEKHPYWGSNPTSFPWSRAIIRGNPGVETEQLSQFGCVTHQRPLSLRLLPINSSEALLHMTSRRCSSPECDTEIIL